jgi:hypothetical protein
MELNALYIGDGKIYIPDQPGFGSRVAALTKGEEVGLKESDKIKVEYISLYQSTVIKKAEKETHEQANTGNAGTETEGQPDAGNDAGSDTGSNADAT